MENQDVNELPEEEEDFYEINQDLLDKRRRMLDQQRQEQALQRKNESYWLKCPKCGEPMIEENMMGILIDRCSGCNGIFFDNGELETLLESRERRIFFSYMKKQVIN